jgi:alpha-tubulin suppressor-like RCC1 family protein
MAFCLRMNKFSKSFSIINASKRFISSNTTPSVLYSWGVGTNGQLGHEKFRLEEEFMGKSYTQYTPRRMLKSKQFHQVAVGNNCSFGIDSNTGNLYGWGQGYLVNVKHDSEPGSKSAIPRLIPMPNDVKISSITASNEHAAAIDRDGLVYTWGNGGSWMKGGGQLGHGNRDTVDKPKLIESFAAYGVQASSVSCGEQHTIILTVDGEVLTFGVGEYGRLGSGSSSDINIPTSVNALENEEIVQVSAGSNHSLALSSTGKVFSWGRNDMGQLGHADSLIDIYSLESVPKVIESEAWEGVVIKSIAAGTSRSAVLSECGKVFLWGSKLNHVPTLVNPSLFGGLKVMKVICGGEFKKSATTVITEDNTVWSFGDGKSQLLGVEGISGKHPTPIIIPMLSDKKTLDIFSGSGQHMFAVVSTEN